MQSLKRIEALPPARRSSMVGQAGVLNELRALDKKEAISWLQRNISSPVTRDWGRLLVGVAANWSTLKAWMYIDKVHALAAADAIEHLIAVHEQCPEGGDLSEIITEIERIAARYQTPKLKSILDSVVEFSKPSPLPKELREAAKLLLGKSDLDIILRDKEIRAKWHSLFHKVDKKYCLTILDWNASENECNQALSSLPIVAALANPISKSLVYKKVDVGSDETIIIALPEAEMNTLGKLMPKSFKCVPYNDVA